MKIVSWDVGIKNLAYCILEKKDDDEKPYIIHEWNVINLVKNEDIKCCLCENKEIKSMCIYLEETKYLCKSHKSYHTVLDEKWRTIKDNIVENKDLECEICNIAL